ncbi:hypothetical protein NQ658_07035 [Acinetobacter baumannii]|nr:hypothetical protein [Acinetobacter baumannii]
MTDSVLECGIIPKGTQISINGIPFVLQEDVKGNASQEYIDKVIEDQNNYLNGQNEKCSEEPCESVGTNSVYEATHKLEVLVKLDNTNACRDNDELRRKVETKILESLDKL